MENASHKRTAASAKKELISWVLVALLLLCAVALRLLTERKPVTRHYVCPEGEYASLRCVYMNPLSSTLSFGDSGCVYSISENSVRVVTRQGLMKGSAENPDWLWREVDDESFKQWFGAFSSSMPDTSVYESRFLLELGDSLALARMDGELWVLELRDNKNDGAGIVWSIFEIAPVESIKIAEIPARAAAPTAVLWSWRPSVG